MREDGFLLLTDQLYSHIVQSVLPTERTSLSPAGSVGASALCAEVSAGDPHPSVSYADSSLEKGAYEIREAVRNPKRDA